MKSNVILHTKEWGALILLDKNDEYILVENTWHKYTSKIKVTNNDLKVIETNMITAQIYYVECVLGDKREEIWNRAQDMESVNDGID